MYLYCILTHTHSLWMGTNANESSWKCSQKKSKAVSQNDDKQASLKRMKNKNKPTAAQNMWYRLENELPTEITEKRANVLVPRVYVNAC